MSVGLVLLVEDNHQDELLVLRALKKVNLANKVEVVRDGQQALDFLFCEGEFYGRDCSEPLAVVLLDLNLPKLNGLEVLRRLRADERTSVLPVVILTSSDEERDLVASYKGGANSFVRKPLDFKEFAETVASLGIYWQAINRPVQTR